MIVVIVVCASVAGCGPEDKPTPLPAPVPSCQSNSTAKVTFGNRSAATTQTVSWDGLIVATLAPGANSTPITTAAGVAHRMEFRIANTNFLACAVSNPIPNTCGDHVYTCAF